MTTYTLIEIIVGTIISIGVLAAGFGYAYSQFAKGKKWGEKEDLDTENALTTYLKNQIEGFKTIVAEQNDRITALGKEVAGLKATIEEKDKTINKYLEILQNRNPELDAFMDKLSQAADTQSIFNGELMKIMKEISTFMSQINIHLDHESKDLKIEATVSKQ